MHKFTACEISKDGGSFTVTYNCPRCGQGARINKCFITNWHVDHSVYSPTKTSVDFSVDHIDIIPRKEEKKMTFKPDTIIRGPSARPEVPTTLTTLADIEAWLRHTIPESYTYTIREYKTRQITKVEWEEEGTKKFGDDMMKWKFVCPACSHVLVTLHPDDKQTWDQVRYVLSNLTDRQSPTLVPIIFTAGYYEAGE
jgi:predicted RNA-binding Zn-ribbon protein involved in translation (DUF1610 family)